MVTVYISTAHSSPYIEYVHTRTHIYRACVVNLITSIYKVIEAIIIEFFGLKLFHVY